MRTFRLRLAVGAVLAIVSVAVAPVAVQTPPRRARDLGRVGRLVRAVAADAGRSGGRRRHAAERPALLRARRTASRRTAPSCGWSSRPGRCSKTTTSSGLAHFVEHMEFEGTRHFPRQSIIDFLSSLGLSIGADANAATSYDDTQYTLRVPTDVPGVLDRALLVLEDWAQARDVRSERHRPRARHRPVRMAHAPRRGRADAGQDPPRAARRIALRGSAADRQARRSSSSAQREQLTALLPRLVPPGPDGGDRRRRRRSRRRRRDDQGRTSRRWPTPSPERPRPAFDVPEHARHALRRRHRQGDDRDRRRSSATCGRRATRDRSAAIATSCSTSCSRAMLGARLDELGAEREPAVPARRRRSRAVPDAADARTKRCCRRSSSNDGVAARPRRARHRAAARRAVRLHRDRARPRQAGDDARLRARRHREPGPRVGEPRRRVHAQLPRRTKRCRRSGRSSRSIAGSSRASRSPRSTRSPRDWFPDRNRLVVVSAPDAAGVVAADRGAARGGRQERRRRSGSSAYVDAARRPDADGRAAGARHDREDDRPRRRPASPSGRCRTARRSCSSRRR